MLNKSRKKNVIDDDLIISNLGVNKDKIKVEKVTKKLFDYKNIDLKKFAFIILILLVFATLIYALRFIKFNAYTLLWKTNVTKSSENVNNKSVHYTSLDEGYLRISNDGVTYIDEVGIIKWTISYNVKDPIYVKSGKFIAIADRNGNNFYIFDKNGLSGENTTANAIVKIALSHEGVIYVLQGDENSSYINVFRNTGVPIDISIKATITEEGMPTDMSTSHDGEELAVSFAGLNDDSIFTKATYYNFGDAGKSANVRRIVGEFINEFKDKFLARVNFFGDNKSCLIYDGGVYYISTSDESNPRIVNKIEFDDKMKSISYDDSHLAIMFDTGKLITLDASGKTLCSRKIDFEYDNFYLDGDLIIFLHGNRVMIYDIRGRMIFDKELSGSVCHVSKKNSLLFSEIYVGLVDSIECIRYY